uniref:Parathyroid hormone n=1 Tax=Hippocampus comes TaxID=109280 RepID=A0A3Q3DIP6_HIPCM
MVSLIRFKTAILSKCTTSTKNTTYMLSSKRTVSEVQLMHNLGERRQVQERRDWLQLRLRGIHTAPGHSRWEVGRARRRLFPELSGLTTEELQEALKIFENLLNSTQREPEGFT